MPDDKLKRINDLIEQLQDEINQPIWTEDQREGLIDAQGVLGDVKQSTQRIDVKYSQGQNTHVEPDRSRFHKYEGGYPSEHDYMTFRDHHSGGVYAYEDLEKWDQIRVLGKYESRDEALEEHPNKSIMDLR